MAFGKTNFAMLLGSGPSKKFNMQSLFQDSPEWPKTEPQKQGFGFGFGKPRPDPIWDPLVSLVKSPLTPWYDLRDGQG